MPMIYRWRVNNGTNDIRLKENLMKYICGFDFIEDDDDKNGDDVVCRLNVFLLESEQRRSVAALLSEQLTKINKFLRRQCL